MTDKTLTVPGWITGLGKYIAIVAPMVFGFWLKVHDLEQDFARHQKQYESKVEALEARANQRDVMETKTSTDLAYIRVTMERVEKTMERLAER